MRRVISWFAAGALLLAAAAAQAYDPVPALRNLYGAPHAVVWLLQVKDGKDGAFVDTMVKAGPYSKLLSGFANEKLLSPLPAQNGTRVYVCFDRYYDKGTAEYVEPARLDAVKPYLAAPPVRIELTLVEHLLANWGWEHGTKQSVLRAEAFRNDEIFERQISSLSFFKSGYVGQVGMLELFDGAASLDEVRQKISQRVGMSGASIYRIESAGGKPRYAAYSEFFRAPKDVAAQAAKSIRLNDMPAGAIAGVVVQNYMAR